jgi:hypothetical protein
MTENNFEALVRVGPPTASEKKQARKEQRALAAAALAAKHAKQVSAGWPQSWAPAQVGRWTEAGGDLTAEQRFEASGWDPSEILGLLDDPEVEPKQAPPAGEADDHRMHGDTLASLLNHEWPPTPSKTIFSLKRTLRSGSRHRWTISDEGGRLCLRQHSASGAGVWRIVREEDAGTDLAGAITAIRTLCMVRRGAINEYTLNQYSPASILLALLRVSATGGDEDAEGWVEGLADEWSDSDTAMEEGVSSLPNVSRWCTIDGARLIALTLGRVTHPLLVDPNDLDLPIEEMLGAREIAHSTWFSESGGAPISWDGGNSLSVVGPLLWARQWGDQGEESAFSSLPQSPRSMAGKIADWAVSIAVEVPTAFALLPFDPDRTLSAAASERWNERFEGVNASISFDLDADDLAHVGRSLSRRSPIYRRVRKAFLHPHGKDGQALATALDGVLVDGVLGQLLWGNWEE